MDIDKILNEAESAIASALDERMLHEVRVRFLGKKGELTTLLKSLGQLEAAERPKAGAAINEAKTGLQNLLAVKKETLSREQLALREAKFVN